MIAKNGLNQEGFTKEIIFVCPKCKASKTLNIPIKIINQSKSLTTVSIPSGLNCQHSFQAFVDKNFKIRGYQMVDFEFSKVEFFESNVESKEGDQIVEPEKSTFSSLSIFQDIIKLLRKSIDDIDILGTGLFTHEGKVLYSSLPQRTLFKAIKEFETREEKQLTGVKRMILELENDEKVCAEYTLILGIKFILVLFFSSRTKSGMCVLLLTRLLQKIEKLI